MVAQESVAAGFPAASAGFQGYIPAAGIEAGQGFEKFLSDIQVPVGWRHIQILHPDAFPGGLGQIAAGENGIAHQRVFV